MNKRTLEKRDGRRLILYGQEPIAADVTAPSPSVPFAPNAHLRWHPLRAEWVAYATHRQHRAFLPPATDHPLAPSLDPEHPTELPRAGSTTPRCSRISVRQFTPLAHDAPLLPAASAEARGTCEVVAFTQNPDTSLGARPLSHIELIVEVWADRSRQLAVRPEVGYVCIFENRGLEVGVTPTHPHGPALRISVRAAGARPRVAAGAGVLPRHA
jgi:UDPglucose--hexose-1-phosphate uridylyltransferase